MSVINKIVWTHDLYDPIVRENLGTVFVEGDSNAQKFEIVVTDGHGTPADLTGMIAAAYVVKENGTTESIGGTIKGNKASITMPSTVYAYPGRIHIFVKLEKGEDKVTVFWGTALVVSGPNGITPDAPPSDGSTDEDDGDGDEDEGDEPPSPSEPEYEKVTVTSYDGFAPIIGDPQNNLVHIDKMYGTSITLQNVADSYRRSFTQSGVSFSSTDGELWTISGTATADQIVGIGKFDVTNGHKYFMYDAKNKMGCGLFIATDTDSYMFNFTLVNGTTYDLVVAPKAIDLTYMYGSGNEVTDETVLKKMFIGAMVPQKYKSIYNAVSGVYIGCGENIAEHAEQIGLVFDTNVTKLTSFAYKRSVMVEVEPGETYTLNVNRETTLRMGATINQPAVNATVYAGKSASGVKTMTITVPNDCHWLVAQLLTNAESFPIATIMNGLMITKSNNRVQLEDTSAYINGMITLRSIGDVRDEIDFVNGTITQRIGERAYSNADASTSAPIITNGTITYYVLDTPVVTNFTPDHDWINVEGVGGIDCTGLYGVRVDHAIDISYMRKV